ncbi:glycoside hydrolase family 31 protein [Armillaria gallica]|uniref:Glucosidase II subunit alpha n=1 Tax=Armillaria gallica TaxID=47427 RepID=A0A2H3EBH5_ARMGA|nr:glycoside hydrolase family 31 protein [Armillaria gallica]
MRSVGLFGALFFALLAPDAFSVKTNDFKTCSQSGFCRRGRALSARAKDAASSWKSPYSVDASSVSISPSEAVVTAAVKSSLYPEIKFELEVRVHEDGVVRVRMDEKDGLRKRYDEAASWALVAEPVISKDVQWTAGKKDVRAVYGDLSIVVAYDPLRVTLLRKGREQVVLNGQGLLHMEHFRAKESLPEVQADGAGEEAQVPIKAEKLRAWFEGEEEDAFWDEKFNSWTDSKPKGPESLSLDITFPNHGTVYGIPQHATRLALPSTTGDDATFSDPYRLYNADVFEYLASSTMSLYGSIPVMHAHSADSTVAIFNAVASETWIDVHHPTSKSSHSHWISESGIMDVFILPGPTPEDVFAQYARLTGSTPLPAHWSLGYHQCRWNYVSTDDVRTVQKRFDEEDMPVDVFWLDIEYAEEHKYFIWEEKTFPDPVEMTNDVAAVGRKMVVIIDPHLKRTSNYPVYQEASDLEILVKPKSGEGEYEGWCWSGSSSWIDMFNPGSWEWWKSVFKFQRENGWSWTNSTDAVHIWNDMNEPSVFNGPEITMPKDNIHFGGWEHRDVHNINGMLFHNLTSQGVAERTTPHKRPFVLTRSFYAGSQRFGAMWTGDNLGTWDHMTVGVQMVLANGIAGMTFAGSDVGGFFGNPDTDMLVRWYQVGIFSPFFRAHAHIDTKRREPFLLDEPYKGMIKDILRIRYSMLPVWYTAFWESSRTGIPVLRPHYVMFPKDTAGFEIDDQFFIASSGLLVKPVTEKDITETTVYLAEDQVYYNYFTEAPSYGSSKGKRITVPLELSTIPLYIRGGSVVPTRERPRRSSPLMAHDPFTLRVALDKTGFSAKGDLYLDDGEGLTYQTGDYVWRKFVAEKNGKKGVRLASRNLSPAGGEYEKSIKDVRVEKVTILGLANQPKEVKVVGRDEPLAWTYKTVAAGDKGKAVGVLVIKDPAVLITQDWEIVIDV